MKNIDSMAVEKDGSYHLTGFATEAITPAKKEVSLKSVNAEIERLEDIFMRAYGSRMNFKGQWTVEDFVFGRKQPTDIKGVTEGDTRFNRLMFRLIEVYAVLDEIKKQGNAVKDHK